jgi:hypothetical protein
MSHEIDNNEQADATDDNAWLDKWAAEHKLTPTDAHEMLKTEFRARIDAWRQEHPGQHSWVIPFHYTHEGADSLARTGALWVPSEGVQSVIDSVGHYIHASAVWEMEQDLFGTGIDVAPLSRPNRLNLQGTVPEMKINRDLLVGSILREQVEKDFNVIIKPV